MSEASVGDQGGTGQIEDQPVVEYLRCSCSVAGFEDPLWVSTYYPSECPEDWRVAYFCNDFNSVYLPADDWVANESLLESMLEEFEPGFDLVLEWPAEMGLPEQRALRRQLVPLEPNIACIVVNPRGLSPADLRAQLQLLMPGFCVNLEPLDNLQTTELAQNSAVGRVWYPEQGGYPVSDSPFQVVKHVCGSLREITQTLKQLDQSLSGDQRAAVFLQSAPNSTQRALETRTVIELMGV